MSPRNSQVFNACGPGGSLSRTFLALVLVACGSSQTSRSLAPDTAADPLPYTPPPANEASTDAAGGLIAVDNGNVAIDVVRGFFEAAASGDRQEIEAFLHEPLALGTGGRRRRPTVSRSRISSQFLSIRRVRGALSISTLVDLNRLSFTAQGNRPGLEPDDRAVLVPIAARGREILGPVLGWNGTSGIVYVRPRLRRIVSF